MELTALDTPKHLQRNCNLIGAKNLQDVGEYLINFATQQLGYTSLHDTDILDVGCGVRFSEVIINREIPIKSYTGVETHKPLIDFLKPEVEEKDHRFKFHHWDRHNDLYNQSAEKLKTSDQMPCKKYHYDVAWMFSVITHQNPEDAEALFHIIHKHVKDEGRMLFTAFIMDIEEFTDLIPDKPLSVAVFNRQMINDMLQRAGWKLEKMLMPHALGWHQTTFVCSKA